MIAQLKKFFSNDDGVWTVLAAAFLFIFAKFWEPGLGLSSTSYGAEALTYGKTRDLLHAYLGVNLLNPFVEHPPLALWLDFFIFKLLGPSAQTIRLLASVLGLAAIFSLYQVARKKFGEQAGVLSIISLFLVTIYMNFNSSGWLDMPMIGFTWLGLFFLIESESRILGSAIGGFFLGCAFLTKGVAALALIPIGIWYLARNFRRPGVCLAFVLTGLVPPLLFSFCYYRSQGTLFWPDYIHRQFGVLNVPEPGKEEEMSPFWYIIKIFKLIHVTAVIGVFAIFQALQKKRKDHGLSWLALGAILIHVLAYSTSRRHYAQYVIPVAPWLALMTGAFLAEKNWLSRWEPRVIRQFLLCVAILFFVIVDLIPVRVHWASGLEYRSLMADMARLPREEKILILGDMQRQGTWEDVASYTSWYWNREVELVNFDEMLSRLSNSGGFGVIEKLFFVPEKQTKLAQNPSIKICLENQAILILGPARLCTEEWMRTRDIEPKQQLFTR